jgi:Fe-S oxidoreductase
MLVLKEVMDGTIELNDELIETLFQCTTCASCSEQCPSGVNVPEIVLQTHTNIYAEDEPEDFERERNKKAEIVYFIGCVGSYREDEPTMETLNLLDRLQVDYTLIDEVCCSGVLEDIGYEINEDLAKKNVDLILATGAKTVKPLTPNQSMTSSGTMV